MATRTSSLDLPLEGSQTEISYPALLKPLPCSQVIADDSNGHSPIIMKDSGLQSPGPSRNPLDLRVTWAIPPSATWATASDNDGPSSNGGHTHPLYDQSSRSCCLSSNMRSTFTRRDSSGQFTSTTLSSHISKGHNPSDDIRDEKDIPSVQWDSSLDPETSSPASGPHPLVVPVKPFCLRDKCDGIDSEGVVGDPSIGLCDQYVPASLQSSRPPLCTIRSSALPNSMGGSDTQSQGSVHYTDRDDPNVFLSNDTESLPDSLVPDLTHEIRNKTLVVRGGYSLVFHADRENSQGSSTEVALKMLWPRALGNKLVDKTLKRLKREARVWISLGHPNIVPLLGLFLGELGPDVGFVPEELVPGLVSPWYSCGNILDYIQRVPNVPREPLCEDVARGLRYLHEQVPPIIHGDLKGANVVVASDGHAALCDFGLSIILDTTGFTSSSVGGTLRFMSPEQLSDDSGPRSLPSDIYAYACTYAQIMTGDPPFTWYKNLAPIVRAICDGESPYGIDTITSHHNLEFLGPSWGPEPAGRPTVSDICHTLGML